MKGWEQVSKIKTLLKEGKNVATVARITGMDRKTVRKYRDMEMERYAERRRKPVNSQKLKNFKDWIQAKVEEMKAEGLINSEVIYQELVKLGYQGSARTLRRYVKGLRPEGRKRIFQPFESPAGKFAQVDFGEKRYKREGKTESIHFACMQLSFSRQKFVVFYDRALDTEMFLAFHQEAFVYFQGVPEKILYDQTKLAVLEDHFGEIEFNKAFHGYAQWAKFEPLVCRPRDPQTKGKVEAVVKYVKRNFLLTRKWRNLADLNNQGLDWLNQVANQKPHEITRIAPKQAWEEERTQLGPMPIGQPLFAPKRLHCVYLDGLVKVLGNRYSVPQAFHGKQVKVRVTDEKVEIYGPDDALLWSHVRALGKGRIIREPSHYEKTYQVPTATLENQVNELFGTKRVAAVIRQKLPRHVREQFKQLLALKTKYPMELIRAAAVEPLRYNVVSYKTIKIRLEHLLEMGISVELVRNMDGQNLPGLEMDPRDAAYYDVFVGMK